MIAVVALIAVRGMGESVSGMFGSTGSAMSHAAADAGAGPDPYPSAFSFPATDGAAPGAEVLSSIVAVTGFDTPVSAGVSGDGSPAFRLCGDSSCTGAPAFGSVPALMSPGQYLQLRLTAGPDGALRTATATVGDASASWIVASGDATPDAFSFSPAAGAARAAQLPSADIAHIQGIDIDAPVSISGSGSPEYRICADAACSADPGFTAAAGSISDGQYLQLRLTTPDADLTLTTAIVTVGTVSEGWDVTTGDATPTGFIFSPATGATLGATVNSPDIVQITGLTLPSPVSVSGPAGSPEYRICADATCSANPVFTSGNGSISNGGYVQLRMTAANALSTTRTASLSVGGVSADWDLTTGATLYAFSSHSFTNCGGAATPNLGPSQAACRSAYSTSWDETDAYFTVSGGIQLWTVPETATYHFVVSGGGGGSAPGAGRSGGNGAVITGDVTLTAGDTIKILVGHRGGDNVPFGCSGGGKAGAGGGGTFVVTSSNQPILVAGGGGGASAAANGLTASTTRNGTTDSNGKGTAGTGGSGGSACTWDNNNGGSGGGLSGNGGNSSGGAESGYAFINGGQGGAHSYMSGGFGGGGADNACTTGGGGAGGYSGGAGGAISGACSNATTGGGGGGGSFINGAGDPGPDVSGSSTATTSGGNGSVAVTKL
jgi:hypothetical protein